MRLARIRWHAHEPAISRERFDLKCWLEGRGARVSAWMLEWECRYD